MTVRTARKVWIAALGVVTLLVASARMVSAQSLEGTWGVEVTPYNCATGASSSPFWTMQSFAVGGTMNVVSTNQALPAPVTPGLGRWNHGSGGRSESVYVIFLLLGPTVQPLGQRITQTVTVTGDQFSGEARGEPFVVPGPLPPPPLNLPPVGCAKLNGRRFP
jgi:hypothetical protein